MRRCVALAMVLGFGACAPRFNYVPRNRAAAKIDGRIAARYDVASPEGSVRVAALGAVTMPDGARALRVRLAIVNAGDQPWTIDVRDQVADLYSDARTGATSVAPAAVPSPIVEIAPRTERAIDLDYPLPPRLKKSSHLPAFVVRWTVRANDRELAAATRFVRSPQLATHMNLGWFSATQPIEQDTDPQRDVFDPVFPEEPRFLNARR
ncbi:MAG TPA: hypothetical protein VFF06_23040 [Polyangia bacterium]|nr:hypothetical protein [Polyangia bacterium]